MTDSKPSYGYRALLIVLIVLFLIGSVAFAFGVDKAIHDPALPRDGQITRLILRTVRA